MAETALARSRAHSQYATLPIERVCGRIHKSLRPAEVRDGPPTARLDAAAGDALCALPDQRGPDALALLRRLGHVGRARLRERRVVSVTTMSIPGSEGAH